MKNDGPLQSCSCSLSFRKQYTPNPHTNANDGAFDLNTCVPFSTLRVPIQRHLSSDYAHDHPELSQNVVSSPSHADFNSRQMVDSNATEQTQSCAWSITEIALSLPVGRTSHVP